MGAELWRAAASPPGSGALPEPVRLRWEAEGEGGGALTALSPTASAHLSPGAAHHVGGRLWERRLPLVPNGKRPLRSEAAPARTLGPGQGKAWKGHRDQRQSSLREHQACANPAPSWLK